MHQDDPEIKNRVKLAVALLVGSKVLNVAVPFLFKHAIDSLNAASVAAGGEAILSMGTAPEAITTVATSILIGCKHEISMPLIETINIIISIAITDGLARCSAAGLNELRNAVFAKVAQNSIRKIAKNLFHHLHNLDLAFHLSRQTGALSKV